MLPAEQLREKRKQSGIDKESNTPGNKIAENLHEEVSAFAFQKGFQGLFQFHLRFRGNSLDLQRCHLQSLYTRETIRTPNP
mgnify:CR=1 FL=1